MTSAARPAPRRRTRPTLPPGAALRGLGRLVVDHTLPALGRGVQELARFGAHGAADDAMRARTVLLFFEDIERDRWLGGDRHVRRGLRRVYHAVTAGQRVSGFEVAFRALRRALERAGYRVVVNNASLARRWPDHPVGLCGYPHILDRWSLPNPALLGPGLYDHPAQAPRLMTDARFRSYIVPCDWMRDLFAPVYGERLTSWFGGIDVDEWPDATHTAKDVDVLLYDKLRWERERFEPALLHPVRRELERRGLRVATVRRGAYDITEYKALLARSRSMLFLCESETQGLAYQEAMACNVPVLAWENGWWLDPNRALWTEAPVAAAAVPYFAPECGERFASADDFPAVLDRFLGRLPTYAPRRYVREALSLERSAALYLDAYWSAGRGAR